MIVKSHPIAMAHIDQVIPSIIRLIMRDLRWRPGSAEERRHQPDHSLQQVHHSTA